MAEEIRNQERPKNTVATIGMWFSIIGLLLLITVFFAWIGFPMLFVGFILGIIGLFYKPREKARIAVIIPLVVFITLVSLACYIWNSVKTPANEFVDWAKPQLEQLNDENFDEDRFEKLLNVEINKIANDKTEEDWEAMFDASTGSNFLEKGSYLLFSVVRESMEAALERYNNGEVVEISEEGNNIINFDVEAENKEENSKSDEPEQEVAEQPKTQNIETFSQSEKNDIEQILDILE